MGVKVTVYGSDVRCASCVNAPGSKETYEWIQAAIARKYGEKAAISYSYFDINRDDQPDADDTLLEQLQSDELFYPLVLVEEEIVGEGSPRLKPIYKALESHGIAEPSST
ncbi:DUF1462 family protein [Halobacillus sp. ACCC02827]|uniref:YuzD family protein n=1 Tax=Bacillaceae TaxID=186817 RepID=UPI0002A5090D|nr:MULTISPECIES: DUF1462 family protein [Bacillaceae]ELK46966.1 hypothetical protein D479_08356 [Halobacillus sp. BAB-2008]QHT47518.1 YuzD family protein [Bacillus sp. SB49]WJE14747.1 DUF1462 family protein [Halobacillus sp. ACCC02827]